MKQIPKFLQSLYNTTEKETRPFSKIFAFINLSEAVIKFYTVVTVQNFLETETGNPSLEEGKAVLGRGLKSPTLGTWAFFTERILSLIPGDKFFWENFIDFFEKELKPATFILVNLRNKYHHGAVPSNEECTNDLKMAMPYLEKILFDGYIGEDRLFIGDVIQGSNAKQVFLIRNEKKLELSPLLHAEFSSKSNSEELYYFNDAKKFDSKSINTISYDISEIRSNKEIYEEFRVLFPIRDWEKTKFSRFANRIAELTENFQGRSTELSKIKNFLIESSQGYIFIWGGPGIGKSALIARSIILVRAGLEEKNQSIDLDLNNKSKNIIIVDYFIRRATITEKEDTFYSMLGEDLETIFKTGISMGNNLQEKKEKWNARLEKIQRKLNGSEDLESREKLKKLDKNTNNNEETPFKGKKLILCIDGLDEGDEGILKSIPRGSDLYSNIIFLLGGRDVTQTRTLYTTLDADKKSEIILQGLNQVDIRAIMLNVANPELITPEYIAKLMKVSEGNPLYLKMICDSIERRERIAGDLENLPAGVDNLYDGIYERFSKLKDSELLLKILYFFTFAKDFLSVDVVAYFLQLEYFRAEFLVGEIREVLWENPMTEDVDDFQLFHESLRDYLRKKYDMERFGVQKMILDGLRGWKDLCEEGIDPRTAKYILQYAVTHLLEEGEQKQAERFVLDSEFVKYQIEYLNFYTVSLDDAVNVLNAIVEELGGKLGTTRPIEEIFKPKIEGEEFRTTTLVRLVNHAGELGHRASTDIGIAWTWVEEGKVAEALERLSPIQDKQKLFDSYIYVLWLLIKQEDGEKNRSRLNLVLQEIEKNIPLAESGTVKWNKNFSPTFFLSICMALYERNLELKRIYNRGEDRAKEKIIIGWLSNKKYEALEEDILYKYYSADEDLHEYFEDNIEVEFIKEDINYVINLLKKIIELTNDIKDVYYQTEPLNVLVNTMSKYKNGICGEILFNELLELTNLQKLDDKLEQSIINLGQLVSSSKNSNIRSNHLNLLLYSSLKIVHPVYKINTLLYLFESICKVKAVELIENSLRGLLDLINYVDPYNQANAIVKLGDILSKFGSFKLGIRTFPVLWGLAFNITSKKFKSTTLFRIFLSSIRLIFAILNNFYYIRMKYIYILKDYLHKCFVEQFSLFYNHLKLKLTKSSSRNNSSPENNLKAIKIVESEIEKNINYEELLEDYHNTKDHDKRFNALNNLTSLANSTKNLTLVKKIYYFILKESLSFDNHDYRSIIINNLGNAVSKINNFNIEKNIYSKIVNLRIDIEFYYIRSNLLACLSELVYKLDEINLGKSLYQELWMLHAELMISLIAVVL